MKHISEAIAKIIPTRFNGVLFRSRTEARWALFLERIGARYQYEHEGYELPSGRYLPDFYLPEWEMFVEVKGDEPTDLEQKKCRELAWVTGKKVLCAAGAPSQKRGLLFLPGIPWEDAVSIPQNTFFARCRKCPVLTLTFVWEDGNAWGTVPLAPCPAEPPVMCSEKCPGFGHGLDDEIAASADERFGLYEHKA